MRFYPPQSVTTPLTLLRRERVLPAPGEILVQQGDRLDPVQVIGRARVPGEFRIVNVAQELGVPVRALRRHLKVKRGQQVKQGQVIASRGLLNRRVCRAPIEGTVTHQIGGRLLIEAAPHEVEVRAGYYGTVARVPSHQSVLIQVSGALIEGAWGNGLEGFGVLHLTVENRHESLEADDIDAASRGVILVAGSGLDSAALERAAELQARGIIVGGIAPELLRQAKEAPFPIMVTEGIGEIAMSSMAFKLLSTHNGREATLDGRFDNQQPPTRPEAIIPLPAEPGTDRLKFAETPLQTGDRVRAVRAPHTGLTGTVLDLPVAMHAATDAQLTAALVQPEDAEEPVPIPLANLEILR